MLLEELIPVIEQLCTLETCVSFVSIFSFQTFLEPFSLVIKLVNISTSVVQFDEWNQDLYHNWFSADGSTVIVYCYKNNMGSRYVSSNMNSLIILTLKNDILWCGRFKDVTNRLTLCVHQSLSAKDGHFSLLKLSVNKWVMGTILFSVFSMQICFCFILYMRYLM